MDGCFQGKDVHGSGIALWGSFFRRLYGTLGSNFWRLPRSSKAKLADGRNFDNGVYGLQAWKQNLFSNWFIIIIYFSIWGVVGSSELINFNNRHVFKDIDISLRGITELFSKFSIPKEVSILSYRLTSSKLDPTEHFLYDTDQGDPFCVDHLTYDVNWFNQNNPTSECVQSLSRFGCSYMWHSNDTYYISLLENVHTIVCYGIKQSPQSIKSGREESWTRLYRTSLVEGVSNSTYYVIEKNNMYHLMSPSIIDLGFTFNSLKKAFNGFAMDDSSAWILGNEHFLIRSSYTLEELCKDIVVPQRRHKKVAIRPCLLDEDGDIELDLCKVIITAYSFRILTFCPKKNCYSQSYLRDLESILSNEEEVDDEHENILTRVLSFSKLLVRKLLKYILNNLNMSFISRSVVSSFIFVSCSRVSGSLIIGSVFAFLFVMLT